MAVAQCNRHKQWQKRSGTGTDSNRGTVQQAQTVAEAQCNKHRQWQRRSATSTNRDRGTVQQAQTVAEAQCNRHRHWQRRQKFSLQKLVVCQIETSPTAATFPQYLPGPFNFIISKSSLHFCYEQSEDLAIDRTK